MRLLFKFGKQISKNKIKTEVPSWLRNLNETTWASRISTPHELMLHCCTLFQIKIPTKQHLATQANFTATWVESMESCEILHLHGNSQLINTYRRKTRLLSSQNLLPCSNVFFLQLVSLRHNASSVSQIPKWQKDKVSSLHWLHTNKFWQSIVLQQCVARKYGSVPRSLGVVSQAGGIYLPTVLQHVLCCVADVSLQFSTYFFLITALAKRYCFVAISIYFIDFVALTHRLWWVQFMSASAICLSLGLHPTSVPRLSFDQLCLEQTWHGGKISFVNACQIAKLQKARSCFTCWTKLPRASFRKARRKPSFLASELEHKIVSFVFL